MAESQDVNALKRRGRRRLVGAIALVLAAVIVLPMVFDHEPKPAAPPVSVRIPSEDDTSFTPKVTPKTPVIPDAPAALATPVTPAPPLKEAAKAPEKSPAVDAERRRAEISLAGGEQFIVPVAALSSPEKVKELTDKLARAKLPYYTEPIATAKGPVTRVRAGPFASRAAAEKALKRLRDLGLKPGNIAAKS